MSELDDSPAGSTENLVSTAARPRWDEETYRPIGPEIDLDIIRAWQRQCWEAHGACCNDRHSDALSKHLENLNLIDVESACLVTRQSTTQFVALSYVWGGTQMLKTRTSNIGELRKAQALSGEVGGFRIPKTIRDAMYLCKQLGQRYLWVDCLCIVQDAGKDKMDEMLRAMAYIYANAEFTIVAAAGTDADHGLRGIGGPSKKREKEDVNANVEDLIRSQGYPDQSCWAQRGWTFQESLFSRRLLVFHHVVSWLCGRVVEHECFKDVAFASIKSLQSIKWPLERPHLGVPMGMMSLIPDVPSLGRWGMLVQDYSARTLTFEGDAIRAFAGASEVMGSIFPGGLLHGLPVFFFDIALLWQPNSALKRRSRQPSWSWTGWSGSVECWNQWHLHYAGIYRATGHSSDWMAIAPLKPVAVYQTTTAPETTTSHTVTFNGFYEYQGLRDHPGLPLPSGWTRKEHIEGHYYTKEGTYRGDFRYGYPLPGVDSLTPTPPLPSSISSILKCTAPLITAIFGFPPTDDFPTGNVFEIPVHSKHATAYLALHASLLFKVAQGVRCHLIAISEAEIVDRERMVDWFQTCHADDVSAEVPRYISNSDSFYNVMWLEWEGDVAYRKALGIVGKKDWDALGAEVTTIKLG